MECLCELRSLSEGDRRARNKCERDAAGGSSGVRVQRTPVAHVVGPHVPADTVQQLERNKRFTQCTDRGDGRHSGQRAGGGRGGRELHSHARVLDPIPTRAAFARLHVPVLRCCIRRKQPHAHPAGPPLIQWCVQDIFGFL